MKFTINIDCTPEEAREFFGFPDIQSVQSEITKQMQENLQNMDPQDMMKAWLPGAMENFSQAQKMMWDAMNTQDTESSKGNDDTKSK